MRVPIVRRDEDGTRIDGTAAYDHVDRGGIIVYDFRDLDGEPLGLPPGSSFEVPVVREVGP